jgi:hypothetical protein
MTYLDDERGLIELASPHRRAGQNGGATSRLRLDEQLATYQLQTFLHAGQAESPASIRSIDVEANPFITNGEIDGVPGSAKMHIEMPDPAVSHRVVQSFLEDPEQTERHVGRYPGRNVLVAEINLGAFLTREFSTETPHCGHDAHMQQPWRVQLVRQRLHIGNDLRGLLLKRVQAAWGLTTRGIRQQSFHLLQRQRQQCEALTDVVVQVPGDPGAL